MTTSPSWLSSRNAWIASTAGAAIAWHRRTDIDKPWLVYGLPSALIVAGLAYGFLRIADGPAASVLPVGLIAIDRASPTNSTGADDPVWGAYAAAVPGVVRAGAKVVVLPEKIARLDHEAADRVRALLGRVASDNAVYLLAGVALVESDHKENRAWLFAPTGALIADYAKHHLLPGFEASFTSGRHLVIRPVGTSRVGIAICKDMDFPTLGRRYAALGVLAPLGSGEPTVYARLGDGFGWLCVIASAAAWLVSLRSRRYRGASGASRSEVGREKEGADGRGDFHE